MIARFAFGLAILSVLSFHACKSNDGDGELSAPASKVNGGKNTQKVSTNVVDGLALSGARTIAVDLSRMSLAMENDQSPIPFCLQPFAPDTELGLAKCVGNDKSAPVLAKHVRQTCQTLESRFRAVEPSEDLELSDCGKVEIEIFEFSPSIAVSLPKK